MISVGQKVRFKPLEDVRCHGATVIDSVTIGTVVMVNEKHSWFSVEYGDPVARTSFKFDDVGEKVHIVKEKK